MDEEVKVEGAPVEPATDAVVEPTDTVETTDTVEEPVETTAEVVEPTDTVEGDFSEPSEEISPEVVVRDGSLPVQQDEVLSEADRIARINYLVQFPDERTAYDPFPADGQAV